MELMDDLGNCCGWFLTSPQLRRAVQLGMLSMAVSVSPYAYALGLGEIQVNSYLGEPLKAQFDLIEFTAADAQELKARLASVEKYKESGLQFPEGVKFRFQVVNEQGAQPFVRVATLRPIDDPFVNLLIEFSSHSGSILKPYTFLLDPPPDSPRLPVAGGQPANVQQTAQAEAPQPGGTSLPAKSPDSKSVAVNAAVVDKPVKTGYWRKKRERGAAFIIEQAIDMPVQTEGGTDAKNLHNKPFDKLSLALSMSLSVSKSDPGVPRSLKDSSDALQEELVAKEKTLNELNAQIAEMQWVIKALQDKLGDTVNQAAPSAAGSGVSAQITVASSVAVTSDASNNPGMVAPAVQLHGEEWLIKTVKPLMLNWKQPAIALIVLLFAVSGLVWYRKRKTERKRGLFDGLSVEHKQPGMVKPSADTMNRPRVLSAISSIGQPQTTVPPNKVTDAEDSPRLASNRKDAGELAEIDSMIEEAELFAIHGHQYKAIEILNDIVLKYPNKVESWLLLLSIFRNKKNARQFESIAKKFLDTLGSNDAWKGIQEAGRSIDPANPLYFDTNSTHVANAEQSIKPNKRRLLGDILIDIKAISVGDLVSSIAHFDHLRDGRLGDYLIALGLIKQGQLDDALQQQGKGVANELPSYQVQFDVHEPLAQASKPRFIGDVLVQMGVLTEQDLEHVLANFEPKLHGHCGSYLVSCGIITNEQFHTALLQQLSGAIAAQLQPAFSAPNWARIPRQTGQLALGKVAMIPAQAVH